MGVYWEGALPIEPRRKDTLRTVQSVEGLNVINNPKCNKVLNVITFCPKCNKLTVIVQISAAFGNGGNSIFKRSSTCSRKYGAKRYYNGFKRRPQISTAFSEKKFNKLRYIFLYTFLINC